MCGEVQPHDAEGDIALLSQELPRKSQTPPAATGDTDADSMISDGGEASGGVQHFRTASNVSNVTMRFDLTGKGYLDDTEKAMRELDTSNRGTLDMGKVYNIMKELREQQREQREQQRRLLNLKRVVFALATLTAVLALSNLGTAFVAARLARDTSVDVHGALRVKGTGEEVSTVSTGTVIHVALGGGSAQPSGGDEHDMEDTKAPSLQGGGDEPLDLWCHSNGGTASKKDVHAAVENIQKGAQTVSISVASPDGTVSSFFLNIIKSHWNESDKFLRIEFTHLFPCPSGDDDCAAAGYRLGPEILQFECDGGNECDVFSCTDEEPIPADGGLSGGLRRLMLSRHLR